MRYECSSATVWRPDSKARSCFTHLSGCSAIVSDLGEGSAAPLEFVSVSVPTFALFALFFVDLLCFLQNSLRNISILVQKLPFARILSNLQQPDFIL